MTTENFVMFKIITLKQEKFSQSGPVLIRQISKNFLSDPVLIRPKLASVLIQSDPVLIRAHLCKLPQKRISCKMVYFCVLCSKNTVF